MAYLDKTRTRPGATSVAGALAINGLMIAGIIFAAPDIVPPVNWTTLITYPVTPDPAPPPPPEQPVRRESNHAVTTTRPPVATKSPDTGLTTTPAGTYDFPIGTGIAIPEPTIRIEPVFRNAQVNPRFANALQPTYPPGMIREEREGVVTVRVLIGTDGRVKAVEAIKANETAFLEATRKQALSKWRFLPATRDGAPIESWREMTVRFELPD